MKILAKAVVSSNSNLNQSEKLLRVTIHYRLKR